MIDFFFFFFVQFPKIGELLLKRLIVQFRRSFQRNDKCNCINTTRFIAHLINQNVAHEILALEILILLLENATNDSVEVAIAFLKECGAKLEDVSRKGAAAIFERLRTILHDGELNKRVQYMIEVMYAIHFEECAHKLLKLDIKPPQYAELCNMIIDCCAQQRTYIKFFGLLAQRFCQINTEYVEPFVKIFQNCYDTIHRFETCKLRNVAKIFAHLLYTDSIPWTVLSHIKLNENDTTSSSRVFIKILFQQLAESMGLVRLNQRIKDSTLDEAFKGLFPRDNPQYTRFAINFFTSIGLGGLTDDLREHLKTMASQKLPLLQENLMKLKQENDDSGSDSSS
ncbi:hypothetical protein BLA29_005098, partial [Euroglyphus maynei]